MRKTIIRLVETSATKEEKAQRKLELEAAIKWYSKKHGGGQGPMATPDQIITKWKKSKEYKPV